MPGEAVIYKHDWPVVTGKEMNVMLNDLTPCIDINETSWNFSVGLQVHYR